MCTSVAAMRDSIPPMVLVLVAIIVTIGN